MITLNIPEISSISGELNDGVVVGKINQSNPVAVLLGETVVPIAQVLRKAVIASGATWVDYTTQATDASAGDFPPFGVASDMSVGDSFYIRTVNDVDAHSFYVQVATAGVGTYTVGLQEWNITTEAWEDVTGFVDNSNGFKSGTGVYQISYTSGPDGKVRLDDVSPKYLWHRFVIKTFTSASVAPVLSRIWMAQSELVYKNVTTAHTSADFSSLPTEILPIINDCLLIVYPGPTMGDDVVITRSASTNYTTTMYYLASDNTYKPLQGVSDESNGFQIAPSTTERKRRWTLPTDWTSKSITDKDNVVHTGYIVCMRITAVSIEGPVSPPQVNIKCRSFGDSSTDGIVLYSDTTIRAISLRIGMSSATEFVIQVLKMSTGSGRSVTIPANAISVNLDIEDIAFTAGNKLGISYQSGGSLRNVEVILQ